MTNLTDSLTFRLFKKGHTSPFIEGMGAILDARGPEHLYNYDKTPAEADAKSIYADWLQVGNDLRGAMREHAPR